MANQPTKYRKFVVGAASAALVASAVAPVAFAADFTDTKGNTHEAAIDALSDAGVITGYEDGTFKPNKTLTRSDVVKLLGKWLVNAKGYKVPTDYKTNPRFADQTSKTNDELLQYSAVVKDNGVFNGYENGSLGATNDITRENMAIVLVRAFDTVNKTDLVAYVAEKTFNKDVTDRAQAKAEARPYIDVLDFFDITNPAAPNFRPKETTTRGQFASFLFNTSKVEMGDVEGTVSSIKAINSTTVEVTFNDKIDDIKSLDFAIEGLTVTNAAVKQTDNKTVVLTTSAQEGKKYTVTVNGKAVGSFDGISAVVPTKIDVTSNSIQAIVGKEVTIQAKVTVPEGQSKLNIPVTFNVLTDRPGVNTGQIKEVYTNAEGVATLTYTQYYGGTDTVVAYPTGAPATRSTEGKVYWGVAEQLKLTEVTPGNTLANGSKKVYKVVAKNRDGGAMTGDVNVAFLENVNVAQDKGVTGVKVTDATFGNGQYPYQYTTGGESNYRQVRVKLDSNGEATFTLTGENASVTPVVFIDGTVIATGVKPETTNGKWDATELQVQAEPVKFDAVQNIEVAVESIGTKDAAAKSAGGNGGRDYKATIRNKDGKLAPEGTKVFVNVAKDDLEGAVWLNGEANKQFSKTNEKGFELTVGKDGLVEFTLVGSKESYATPTVYLNNGEDSTKLDPTDAQAKGEIVYFGDAVLKTATLKAYEVVSNKEVKSVEAGETVAFRFQVTDQNGKPNTSQSFSATYEVTNAGFVNAITANGVAIDADKTKSIPFAVNNGVAELKVSAAGPTSVKVDVSSSQVTLDGKVATVEFTDANVMGNPYTANVTSFDKAAKKIALGGKKAVSYAGANFKQYGANTIDQTEFETLIQSALANGTVKVTATKDSNGVYTFDILEIVPTITVGERAAKVNVATTADEVKAALAGLPEYENLTQTDKDKAVTKILTALTNGTSFTAASLLAALVADVAPAEGLVFTSLVAEGANDLAPGLGMVSYDIQGTVGDAGVSTVKLTFPENGGDFVEKTVDVPVVDGKFKFEKAPLDKFGHYTKVVASYVVNGETKTFATDLVLRIKGEAQITETVIEVEGKNIQFTDIVGASAKLDLTSLAASATANEITVTVTEDSTFTMSYGGKTKSVELVRGENIVSPADLFPGLNPSTTLSVGFLQNLEADGTLEVATSLVAGGVTKTGTLTISYDPKQ